MQPRPRWNPRLLILLAASAAFWSGLIAAIHRESPRTLVSAHGFLHSAIVQRFSGDQPIAIPPENPFFAGEPLPYYWLFHAGGACVGRALGIDPLHGLEVLILVGMWVLVFGCGWLAQSLYRNGSAGLVITYLVLAGANAQAPVVLGARLLRKGTGVLTDNGHYLWGIAHPLLGYMRLWDPYALYGPLLSFFFNITARPLAIAALIFVLLALHQVLTRGGLARAVGLAVAAALCSALSAPVGVPTLGALAGALLLLAPLGRPRAQRWLDAARLRHTGTALAAMGAGTLLGSLTFWHLLGTSGRDVGIMTEGVGTVLERGLAMLAAAWVPLLLSLWGTTRVQGERRHFLVVLLLATFALMAATALLSLPASNHVNLFHAALTLLAVSACSSLFTADDALARGRTIAVVAVFLPTLLLIIASYTDRPPVPLTFRGSEMVRVPPHSDHARLYSWITASTAPDAVFVIDPRQPIRAMSGNTAELPAFTRRTLFTARTEHYIVAPHPDAERRGRIARSLLSGRSLARSNVQYLEGLGRDIYLVVDDAADPRRSAALRARYGKPQFEGGRIAAFRWSPLARR